MRTPKQSETIIAIVASVIGFLSSYFLPTEDVVIPLPTPAQWFVVCGGEVVDCPSVVSVANDLESGKYEVLGFPKQGKLTQKVITIIDNNTPTPIPPKPEPEPPKPDPPKPIEVGKRTVVILRETAGTNLKTQSLLIGLRTGEASKYIADKGHKLFIVDVDSTDENNAVINSWKTQVVGMKLPVVLIAKDAGKELSPLAKRELKSDETPDNVIEYLRQNGG